MPVVNAQIPASRVPLVDPDTGLVNRDWYRFLANLYTLSGQGSNAVSLSDLQVGPPDYQDIDDPEVTTVDGLMSVTAAGAGARSFVTDATQTLTAGIGAVVVGGGANSVPVVCDGTNWRIG